MLEMSEAVTVECELEGVKKNRPPNQCEAEWDGNGRLPVTAWYTRTHFTKARSHHVR